MFGLGAGSLIHVSFREYGIGDGVEENEVDEENDGRESECHSRELGFSGGEILGEIQVREGRVFDPFDGGDMDKSFKQRKDRGEDVAGEYDADGEENGEGSAFHENGNHHGQGNDDKQLYKIGEVGEEEFGNDALFDYPAIFERKSNALSAVKAVEEEAHNRGQKEGDEEKEQGTGDEGQEFACKELPAAFGFYQKITDISAAVFGGYAFGGGHDHKDEYEIDNEFE